MSRGGRRPDHRNAARLALAPELHCWSSMSTTMDNGEGWRRSLTILALAVTILGGCAADDGSGVTTSLTFTAGDAPQIYLAVADGDGPWQQVPIAAGATVTVDISGAFFAYARGCGSSLGLPSSVAILRDAGAPEAAIQICPTAPVTSLATLSGTVTPATAEVNIGTYFVANGASPTYWVRALTGRYDIIATDTVSPRMLVVRGVELDADRTLALDLAAGFDRVDATPVVTGAEGTTIYLVSTLHTGAGAAALGSVAPGQVGLVPAAERQAGDRLEVRAVARSGDAWRLIDHDVADVTVPGFDFTPMPALTVDRTGFGWDGLHAIVSTVASQAPPAAERVGSHQAATAAWQIATGRQQFAWVDPGELPGWGAGWGRFEVGAPIRYSVTVDDRASDGQQAGRSLAGTW
ncbi:MAG: hypothetical protein R3B06_11600 [Kofleriaceae bacterium]